MVEAAKSKESRIEAAIAALRENDGTEKQMLQGALKGVKKVAQNVPVGVHLLRAQKHFAAHGSVASWCWSSRRAKPVCRRPGPAQCRWRNGSIVKSL